MRDHSACKPGFKIRSEDWDNSISQSVVRMNYQITASIWVGFYPADGTPGSTGELALNWFKCGMFPEDTIALEVFDDGFSALKHLPGLIDLLDYTDAPHPEQFKVTPEFIIGKLKELGYEDMTERKRPEGIV